MSDLTGNRRKLRARTLGRSALVASVVVVAALAGAAFRPGAAAQERPPDDISVIERETERLVAARRDLARSALETIDKRTTQGSLVNNPIHETYRWSLRLLGAEIYLSMRPDETRVEDPEVYLAVPHARPSPARDAAFAAHLRRMKVWEARWRPLLERNLLSRFEYMEVEHHVLEAQLWLTREHLKQAKEAAAPRKKAGP